MSDITISPEAQQALADSEASIDRCRRLADDAHRHAEDLRAFDPEMDELVIELVRLIRKNPEAVARVLDR